MTHREGGRVPIPAPVWWLAMVLAVLVAGAVLWGVPHVRDDLTARSEQALAAAGYGDVRVDFDGRDAQVRGEVAADADAMAVEELVAGIRGVRRVDKTALSLIVVDGDAMPTTTLPLRSSTLEVIVEPGGAVISGVVPSREDADSVIAAAEARFGDGNVVDNIEVDPSAQTARWIASIADLISGLEGLQFGSLRLGPEGVIVEGAVPDAAAGDAIVVALQAATGETVEDQLAVPGPAQLAIAAQGDEITLSGQLPTEAAVSAIATAADAAFASVDNRIEVAVVQSPAWLERVPDLFSATGNWSTWTLALGEAGASFAGFAPDEDALEAVRDGIAADLGVTRAGFAAEIEPEAVAAELTSLLAGSTTFSTGSTSLSPAATEVLDRAIEILAANPSTVVTVEGHTDNQGSDEGNQALSQARADAVVEYLVDGGIAAGRLTAIGYGEERPVGDNATGEGRAQNRRITFVVETEGAS